jgi:hypothetical protein
MSETMKRFLHATMPLASKGDLVVIPTAKSLPDLAADIRRLNSEVENALLTAVARGIEAGKSLITAKKLVKHGNFEAYVIYECHISVSAAQNYMKLAKHEDIVRPLLSPKTQGVGYLKMTEALRLIENLRGKKKLKKPKAEKA